MYVLTAMQVLVSLSFTIASGGPDGLTFIQVPLEVSPASSPEVNCAKITKYLTITKFPCYTNEKNCPPPRLDYKIHCSQKVRDI